MDMQFFLTGLLLSLEFSCLNNLPCSLTVLRNDKVKFQAAFRIYFTTHSCYSVDEFFMVTDLWYCFVKCVQYFTL